MMGDFIGASSVKNGCLTVIACPSSIHPQVMKKPM